MTIPEKKLFSSIDKLTLFLYFIIVIFGLTAIYIVDHTPNQGIFYNLFSFKNSFSKQFYFAIIALLIIVFILLFESNFIVNFSYISYFIGIGLMVLTIFVGLNINGSRSWIKVAGGFNLQPVELCKIFTSLAIAKYFSKNEKSGSRKSGKFWVALFIIIIPLSIGILQHELGQAIIYFSMIFALYREGLPSSILIGSIYIIILVLASLLINPNTLVIIIISVAAIIFIYQFKRIKKEKKIGWLIGIAMVISIGFQRFAVPYIFNNLFECYQSTRVYNLFGKSYDCSQNKKTINTPNKISNRKPDDNYNVKQSIITIGSGGLMGKGMFKSTQTKGKYVPEQNTDFIFTSIGEAFGFIGCLIFILVYLVFLLNIGLIAERQRSTYARVYGYCVLGFFFLQFAININMTLGLFPVVGITLPFISYGGASFLTFTIMLFILLKLDIDKQKVFT